MMLWYFEVGVPLQIYVFNTNHMGFSWWIYIVVYYGFVSTHDAVSF